VRAPIANFDVCPEKLLTLAAGASDSLSGLLVNEVLASCLGRLRENNLLLREIPIGDDGWVLRSLLENGGPFLAALFSLGLSSRRGHARALLATRVLALRALLSEPERCAAVMALAVHTHLDGFLNAQHMALGRIPFARLEFDAIELAEFLRTLRKNLRPRNLLGFHSVCLLACFGGRSAATNVSQEYRCHVAKNERNGSGNNLVASVVAGAAAAADVLPLVDSVDSRRSAFFQTVLTLESTLPRPFFSLSFGTSGPSCAGELMMGNCVGRYLVGDLKNHG
jgi:hypothetical protein